MRAICIITAALLSACASTPSGGLRTITVANAPKAIGPYSQAVVANGFVYTAGQTPRDPVTGNAVEGDIDVLTNRVFDNLAAILRGASCTLQDVVKVNVYMTDLAEFGKMNEVYAARFGEHRPARSTVQVAKLPGNARIEIEMIARLPK
jgi:2-iminobutanoate/2-iminopropanoate deaminase